jgi:hypothetical protein
MNVFHGTLKTVEASCLWKLDFAAEILSDVFQNDSVRSSEEGKNVFNEVLLISIEFLPVLKILS